MKYPSDWRQVNDAAGGILPDHAIQGLDERDSHLSDVIHNLNPVTFVFNVASRASGTSTSWVTVKSPSWEGREGPVWFQGGPGMALISWDMAVTGANYVSDIYVDFQRNGGGTSPAGPQFHAQIYTPGATGVSRGTQATYSASTAGLSGPGKLEAQLTFVTAPGAVNLSGTVTVTLMPIGPSTALNSPYSV